MKRSRHSILTSERMKAADARRADASRARARVHNLPAFAEAGLLRLRVDTSSVEAILAFAALPDAEERWMAAGGRAIGWTSLQEFVAEARVFLD